MLLMVLFSSFVVIQNQVIRLVILLLGAVGLIVVWFFVPTAQPLQKMIKEKKDVTGIDELQV